MEPSRALHFVTAPTHPALEFLRPTHGVCEDPLRAAQAHTEARFRETGARREGGGEPLLPRAENWRNLYRRQEGLYPHRIPLLCFLSTIFLAEHVALVLVDSDSSIYTKEGGVCRTVGCLWWLEKILFKRFERIGSNEFRSSRRTPCPLSGSFSCFHRGGHRGRARRLRDVRGGRGGCGRSFYVLGDQIHSQPRTFFRENFPNP